MVLHYGSAPDRPIAATTYTYQISLKCPDSEKSRKFRRATMGVAGIVGPGAGPDCVRAAHQIFDLGLGLGLGLVLG